MYDPINVRMMTFIMFSLFNIFYNPQAISSLPESLSSLNDHLMMTAELMRAAIVST